MIYKDIVINRPGKTSIHKAGGYNYVYYTVKAERVGKTKYYKEKRISIGAAIDGKTFHPNDNYFVLFPDDPSRPELPEEKHFADTISVGAVMAIQNTADNMRLTECLMNNFDRDGERRNTDAILDFASYSLIRESTTAQYFPYFRRRHAVLSSLIMDDNDYCSFFREAVSETAVHSFFAEWIEKQKTRGTVYISYDSTNINTGAGVDLAEYGYAKDDRTKPIVNVSYVFDQDNGIPLFYELYSGSVNDVSEFKKMTEKAKRYNLNESVFVTDRGYFSKENIREICSFCSGYVVMTKLNALSVRKAIELSKDSIESFDSFIPGENISGAKVRLDLFGDGEENTDNFFYVYFDPQSRGTAVYEARAALYGEYSDIKARINTVLGDNEINSLKKRFILKLDGNNRLEDVSVSREAWERKISSFGYFVIASNLDKTPGEIYGIYKKRDSIEKVFRNKTYTGMNELGVQSDISLRSKMFINFIAAIIRSRILKCTETLRTKDRKTYTVPGCIEELEKIDAARWRNDEYSVLYALTRKQKNILAALGVSEDIFHTIRRYN